MPLEATAGQILSADDFNALVPRFATKAANEDRTSTTTIANDSDLFLDLPAQRRYFVTLRLNVTGSTSGDLKLAWTTLAIGGGVGGTLTVPGGLRGCLGPALGMTSNVDTNARLSVQSLATEVSYGIEGSGTLVQETLLVDTGVSGGRLQLQWAQNASSATATSLRSSGCFLVAQPIS